MMNLEKELRQQWEDMEECFSIDYDSLGVKEETDLHKEVLMKYVEDNTLITAEVIEALYHSDALNLTEEEMEEATEALELLEVETDPDRIEETLQDIL